MRNFFPGLLLCLVIGLLIGGMAFIEMARRNRDLSARLDMERRLRMVGNKEIDDDILLTIKSPEGWVAAVAFMPDGKSLVSASADKTAALWDAASGEKRATFVGHKDYVTAVAVTSDGKTLATGGSDATVRLWDVAKREERAVLRVGRGEVRSVAFGDNGKLLAAGTRYGVVRVWDAATKKEVKTITGKGTDVWAVAFTPDGRTLATTEGDWKRPSEIKLWDTETWRERGAFKHTGEVLCLAISGDGGCLAAGSWDRTIKVWRVNK